jgi:glycosyltransferase involved in cell wall biosynthesis
MAVQGACPELEGVQRPKPLLSICIPTYNRARLLESALLALIPQVNEAAGAVELIVSDNCSTDDTETVVQSARSHCPILYSRNAQNEGFARNVLRVTNELARGEFAWVLGDDDLVRPDGVQRILTVLEAHPDVDYVFVNLTTSPLEERQRFIRPVTGADFPELAPTKGKSLEDRCVASWEELIDPRVDEVFLGSIMCSVFRLALWREYELKLPGPQATFATLAASYPHTVILAHTMRGRKAYYIGYPCAISFWGTQEWHDFVPVLICVRLQELLNLYRRLGVDKARVEMCRQSLLSQSGDSLQALLLHDDTPGREWFSLPVFCWRNRHHLRELRETLRPSVVARLPRRVRLALRATKRGGQMLGTRIHLGARALAALIRRPWR